MPFWECGKANLIKVVDIIKAMMIKIGVLIRFYGPG